MSSPNEPGPSRAGEGAGTNGSNGPVDAGPRSGAGHGEHAEPPPWQRGATRNRPPQRPADAPPTEGGRGTGGAHSPVDARLNRFMTGGPTASKPAPKPASTREADVPGRGDKSGRGETGGRGDTGRPESYASELPDLSGSSSRAPQRTSGPATSEASAGRPNSRLSGVRAQVGPVRASMQIRRLDPWSVLKVSVILSVALFFVWMIAVAFLYLVLGGMGVWAKLNSNVGDLLTNASGGGGELVSSSTIFGGAALIGLINIVLLTAMATCGAFIYNLTTDLVGGIEVTLADRD